MSMSEFERQPNKKEEDSTSFLVHRRVIPADFSEEDIAFAQELDTLFALDEEDIPPYFVQTLLEPDDPGFQVVEPGFERKTRARVFRRLHLHRRLFSSRWPPPGLVASGVPVRRSLVAVIAACMLLMLFTVAFTSQSFVEGVAVLLHGARAGVYQVHTYPRGAPAVTNNRVNANSRQISLIDAQYHLHFPMYWPQVIPDNYDLDNMYLYEEPEQSWADGPILELQYHCTALGRAGHPSGEIAILEFKPIAEVLQVVEDGSFQTIVLNTKEGVQAIYVDGQWVSLNHFSHRWVYGGRSELIYQKNGVVFWIVGDQRHGIDKDVLLSIAQSLQVVNIGHIRDIEIEMADAVQLLNDPSGLFTGDIIAALPDDGEGSPYLIRVGPDQAPQEKPIQKHGLHSS